MDLQNEKCVMVIDLQKPPPELPFGCMATYEQKSILNSQPLYFHSFIPSVSFAGWLYSI